LMSLEDIDKEPPAPVIQNVPAEQPTEEQPGEEEVKTRIAVLERANTKLIEYRSVIGRDKVSNRYYPLIRDAAERIVLKEAKAISKNVANGKTWVDNFYKQMPEYIRKQMGPVMSSFQESIMDQAAREVGGIDTEKTLDEAKEWIDSYFDVYVKRHIGRSTGQINQLMEEEDSSGLVTQRMDEWMERRPDKIAGEETVRGANSAAQFVFWSVGFSSIWRIRGAETCDYCKELNGRKIRQGQTYFNGGEDFKPRSFRISPMHISGPISHPPLHQGCDCYIDGRAGEGTATEIDEPVSWENVDSLEAGKKQFNKKYKIKKVVFDGYSKEEQIEILNKAGGHLGSVSERLPGFGKVVKKGTAIEQITFRNSTNAFAAGVDDIADGFYDNKKRHISIAGTKAVGRNRITIFKSTGQANLYASRTVCEDVLTNMMHEMGHHYNYSGTITSLKEFEKVFNKKGADYFLNNVSLYSTTNYKEAFAESFAMVTAPNYKIGTLSKDIEDVFKVLK